LTADFAASVRGVLAEAFDVDPADFAVVDVDGHLTLVYSADMGVYRGSYADIWDHKSTNAFVFEVLGKTIDTRSALTYDVYCAFVRHLVDRGVTPLPDSHEYAELHQCHASYTWLTGEPARGVLAQVGLVLVGAPYRNALSVGDRGMASFRPSAPLS